MMKRRTPLIAIVVLLSATACSAQTPTPAASSSESASTTATASVSATVTPTPTPSTIQTALQHVKPAVAKVTVSTWYPMGDYLWGCGIATGTAFAISSTLLVTSAHVVEDRDRLRVTWEGRTQPGKVVGYDRDKDVALLQVPGPLPGELAWRDTNPDVGEEVATFGYSQGQGASFVDGNINRVNQKADVAGHYLSGLLEMDFSSKPGNSGGPVFDKNGAVLGIVAAGPEDGSDGGRYAVSAAKARPLVKRWAELLRTSDESRTACRALPGSYEDLSGNDVPEFSAGVHSAAMTLLTYINAINDADYASAHAQLANGGDLASFTAGVESSYIDQIQYDRIVDESTPSMDVSFRSQQEAGKGPAERPEEKCTQWHLHYSFTARDDIWLISKSLAQDGASTKNEPCETSSPDGGPDVEIGG